MKNKRGNTQDKIYRMDAKTNKQKELYGRVKSKHCVVKHREIQDREEENAQVDVEIKR